MKVLKMAKTFWSRLLRLFYTTDTDKTKVSCCPVRVGVRVNNNINNNNHDDIYVAVAIARVHMMDSEFSDSVPFRHYASRDHRM